jgi:hypothetical protein
MIVRTFSSWPTCCRIDVARSSAISRSKNTSTGARPVDVAIAAIVWPTASFTAGFRTPPISMVSHSITQPWQPSEPTCSIS